MAGLLERERELSAFGDALGEARAGSGRVVLVEAPAGLGKTSLLQAAAGLAADAGLRVLGPRRRAGARLSRTARSASSSSR